jgi:hypothetical protein
MKHKRTNKRVTGMPRDKTQSENQTTTTDNLQEQVKQVFALQPHIAQYIPGSGSTPVSAEALVFCYLHENRSFYYGAPPLVSADNLLASEASVRADLAESPLGVQGAPREETNPIPIYLDLFRVSGLGWAPSDRQAAIIRLLAASQCLLLPQQLNPQLNPGAGHQVPDDSVWELEVEGRPDLTALKKHILTHGGKRFQSDDFIAAEITPDQTAHLMKKGTFRSGKGAQLIQQEKSKCHENAFLLAHDEGMELWTGFALIEGIWRVHSWCVRNNQIIETAVLQEQYFGVHFPLPFSKLLGAVLHKKASRHTTPPSSCE